MQTFFSESTVKSLWGTLAGRLWRAWYRLKSKVRRMIDKSRRRAYKLKTDPVSIGSKFGNSMAHAITLAVVIAPIAAVFGWALSGPRRMRITRYLLNEIFEQR